MFSTLAAPTDILTSSVRILCGFYKKIKEHLVSFSQTCHVTCKESLFRIE